MEEILRHMFMVDVLVSPTVALALLFGLFSTKFRYALLAGLVFGLISVGFGVLSYDNPQDWDFWLKYRICAFFIDCLLGALVIWACKKLILTIKGKPDRLFFALQKETATGRETATFIGLLCMVLTIVTIGVGIIVGGRIRNVGQFLLASLLLILANLGYLYVVARSVFKAFDITEIIVVSLILSILPIGIGVVIRYLRDKQLERRYRKLAAAEGVELILDELSQISETTELHGNSKAATYGFINED